MESTTTDVFAKARGHERAEQLRAAREADVLPYFRLLEGPARPVVEMEGAERIMLGSNNYLGLTADERVVQGARDALEAFGTGLTGWPFRVPYVQAIALWLLVAASTVTVMQRFATVCPPSVPMASSTWIL